MKTFLALYLLAVAAALGIKMLRDYQLGRHELLSVRNFAIVGFIVFQLTSAAMALATNDYGGFTVMKPESTGLIYCAMVTTFLLALLWAYRGGWGVKALARRLPTTWAVPGNSTLMVMAVLVTGAALVLRHGLNIGLLTILSGHAGMGVSALGAGLVGWVWGRRFLNPMFLAIGIVVIVANLLIVTTGSFGRRGIVGVGAAVLWGMYYARWRYLPTATVLTRLGLAALVPVVILALFTSVRGSARIAGHTAQEHVRLVLHEGDITYGVRLLAGGQNAGSISMWLIENYPENFEYRHLMALRYLAVFPVPRMWWPEKPLPLSNFLASMAGLPNVDTSKLKLGPGVIGTAAAEGGWYAVIVYAIAGGLFLRFFDEIVGANPDAPAVIVAVGAALGQIVGLARGSMPAMIFIAVMSVFGAMVCMLVLGKLLERTSLGGRSDDGEYAEDWVEEYAIENYGDTDDGAA